jgi:putative oxidoreductase
MLRIKTKLTLIAAIGISLIMVFAAIFHLSRGESNAIGMNIILGGLAGLVTWLRLKKAPLQDKVSKTK